MKLKPVNVELLDSGHRLYGVMRDLIAQFHTHLVEARIALAWNLNWSEDHDGRLVLGKCKKASDLEKEFHAHDFVILLNRGVVNSSGWSEAQTRALLDHELSHCGQVIDAKSGDQKQDDRGRLCWRVRKHDIEEFRDVVRRHGCYKSDLEEFAQVLVGQQSERELTLFDQGDGESERSTKRA